jgi:predicted MFS family arabinose efflux permease
MATRLPTPPIDLAPAEKLTWVNRSALIPGAVFAFGTAGMIGFSAYVPLYGDELHMSTVQYVFLLYSGTVVAVRLLGRIHRQDPVRVAQVAMTIIAVGLAVIATVPHPWALYVGTVIFAGGIAIQFPALMGIALRNAKDHERVGVIATYTACQDLSQGLSGLILGGATYFAGYRASFGGGAIFAVCGLVLLIVNYGRKQPAAASASEASSPTSTPA